MVDERRVRLLLQRAEQDLAYLRARAAEDPVTVLDDEHRMRAVKHAFITTIEGCLSVAQHICASEGWGPPTSNADAMRLLGGADVVPTDLASVMVEAVGFRNVLVHGYAEVDDERVVSFFGHLDELARFMTAVSSWVAGQE